MKSYDLSRDDTVSEQMEKDNQEGQLELVHLENHH